MLSMLLRRRPSALHIHLQLAQGSVLTSSCLCSAGSSEQHKLEQGILDAFLFGTSPVGQHGTSRQVVLNVAWATRKQPIERL